MNHWIVNYAEKFIRFLSVSIYTAINPDLWFTEMFNVRDQMMRNSERTTTVDWCAMKFSWLFLKLFSHLKIQKRFWIRKFKFFYRFFSVNFKQIPRNNTAQEAISPLNYDNADLVEFKRLKKDNKTLIQNGHQIVSLQIYKLHTNQSIALERYSSEKETTGKLSHHHLIGFHQSTPATIIRFGIVFSGWLLYSSCGPS